VRVLAASAGLHIAALVDTDDEALHDASVAEHLIVGSLSKCYQFTPPPSGLLLGFGSVPDDAVDDAMDAVDRMLLRLYRPRGGGRH
jgi:hypothetical protein